MYFLPHVAIVQRKGWFMILGTAEYCELTYEYIVQIIY